MTDDPFLLPPHLAEALRQSRASLIVTGGGGWIGRNVLEILDATLGEAIQQRVRVYGSSDRPLVLRSGRVLQCRKLEAMDTGGGEKLFLHCAFMTRDRIQEMSFESYVAANEHISDVVAASVSNCTLHGFFMPSSGAVYKKGTHILDEDINANPYGVLKQQDEQRFLKLAAKAPLCVPRVFNLSGAFINKTDIYALASMIKAALAQQPITIRAAHRVVRSYIHVLDLLTLAFSMLLVPQKDDVAIFDTCGDENLELAELADRIRKAFAKSDLPISRPPLNPDTPDDIYVGQGEPMARLIKAHGFSVRSMTDQIRDTANYLAKA